MVTDDPEHKANLKKDLADAFSEGDIRKFYKFSSLLYPELKCTMQV